MPNKAELYAQMAGQTAVKVTQSWQEWTAFLTTAARLYKYPYHEQLMIYAQRPDATACAEYDLWNEKMGRYVRRGSKGIALLDDSGDRPKLRYVFDVSDTGEREYSRRPWLWDMGEEYLPAVTARLKERYGVEEPDFPQQLASIAGKLAGDYWDGHRDDIIGTVDGSFLEEYDEFNTGVQFRSAATVSITYALMSRCGLEPETYLDHEDFMAVFDFNTPATVAALGTAVSQINQEVLRLIGATIRNAEREKAAERRANEQHPDLQTERRLPDSGPDAGRNAGEAAGQIRQDEENIPERTQASPIQSVPAVREAVPASAGDGGNGRMPAGTDDAAADERGGDHGAGESQRPHAVGTADEQLQGTGGGSDPDGAYQQLTLNLFPSEAEQIRQIEEEPNTQQVSGSFSVSQADIDAELRRGSGFSDGRLRIYALYQHNPDAKAATAFLKDEYGSYGRSLTFLDGSGGFVDYSGKGAKFWWLHSDGSVTVKWTVIEKRLRQLIAEGNYLTEQEAARYAQLERAYAGIEGGVPVPSAGMAFPAAGVSGSEPEAQPEEEQRQQGEMPDQHSDPQAAIDDALREWNGDISSKQAVARYMREHSREKETAEWLRREYGDNLPAFPVPDAQADLPWPRVQRRIAQLIREDRYYTEPEKDNLDNIDPVAIREELKRQGIENGQVVDGDALNASPFIRQVMDDVQEAAAETIPEKPPAVRDIYEQYLPVVKDLVLADESYRNACLNSDQENAYIEGAAAIKRAVAKIQDAAFMKLYYDSADFHNRLQEDVLAGTYPVLSGETVRNEAGEVLAEEPVVGEHMEEPPQPDTPLPDLSDYPVTRQGDTVTIGDGPAVHEAEIEVSDEEWEQIQESIPEQGTSGRDPRNGSITEYLPAQRERVHLEGVPVYHVGDAVVLDFGNRIVSGTVGYVGENDVRVDTGPYSWSHETVNREQFEEILRRDERNAGLFETEPSPEAGSDLQAETVAVYPGDKNGLPYDIVVERLHTGEPERTPPAPAAGNYHITDDALGEGGSKEKFWRNIKVIATLKQIEGENRNATLEEQHILSQYVGWGGLADAFDRNKAAWASEYEELKGLLTPEEYDSARASTLNAHYTSPAVIKAIYEAVGNMGFRAGNILEPSCGVGNFFGLLPEDMAASRLYGVELDPISGRIAKKLYPEADITVAGFETTDRKDFYDLAVGNVPFGQYQVNDPAYNKLGFTIHNYFFAKALGQVRPGGVVAFVTSRYTMDAKSPEVRKYLAQRAELLGAIRLPNNAFRANAGTDVVSDIIFLQKRDRPVEVEPDWVHLGENEDGFVINSYFVDHPEMILGRQSRESTQYGKEEFTVEPIEGLELADQLHDAVRYIRGTYQEAELPDLGDGEAIDQSIPADPDVKNYSYTVVDGEVYFRENSRMVRPDLNATAEARVKGMVAMRDCVHQLIDLQMDEYTPDTAVLEKQEELNRMYDSFTAKYGLINDRGNRLAFSDDSSYYLLCALEVLDEDGKLERKADMFTKRTIKPHRAVSSVDTASEALAVSIAEKARVDMEYMAQLAGKTTDQIAAELTGVIFKDPACGDDALSGWQTADEYLSGNVRRKLRQAQRAAERDPAFSVNVEALKAAQPKDLDASEIEVRLGATWVSPDYIRQFMYETFDTPRSLQGYIDVKYAAYTAEWRITAKNAVSYTNVAAYTTYGTDRANAYHIMEDSLNLRDVRIYDTVEDENGKERRVLNAKETTLAAQKQQAIREAFKDWIWKDPQRRQDLVRQYNEEMNSTRPREYDGSHIVFSGMNPEIILREHQKNAVAHVMYGGNTLLAHEVGAGKTFEMVAAAMESKRLGLCQKSIFVVPNHLTEQWASEFLRLYPSANILVTTKKDFETRNRKKFCARIATGDYDAVIIGHSQFERIPISRERQERLLREQISEITDGIAEVKGSGGEQFTIKQLERTRKGLETRLEKLQADGKKDDVVTFEQLGVDRMFVDEAHNYKNMFLYTKMRNVAGLSTTDAQKSSDMFAKCRYLDEITGSRGVVFATGTPVSNSMTELYTMQRYLQYERLKEMDMTHFDCWASRFGETATALELAPEGTGYRARTRFSKFFNLPELMNLFKEIADIKTADQLHLPVPEVEYHNVVAKPTEPQKAMVQVLSERAAKVHAGSVDPSVDNMLKITSDGRKLGLDQRIINPMLPDEEGTKVNQCVGNILQIWRDGEAEKLTQLVFCDISTPKAQASRKAAKAVTGNLDNPELHALETAVDLPEEEPEFTVYEDIRQKLVSQGVPAEQIAFIHEANTEFRKKELFAKVRTGQIRVLLGSTFKMGAGTNVQDRLVAIHDLDCPWRPGDLEQRKGRIVRQGNGNETVHVYRYVTEGTFDGYLWVRHEVA